MRLLLANPRGFCAGVDRAIDIVERALALFGAPIYVRHEVVHNRHVVERLRSLGAIFVEELSEVPDDATVIFSAHGVSRAVQEEAARRQLNVFDATCPLVTKVHMEVTRYARDGREVVLIGHAGHPEVEGTMGQFDTAWGGEFRWSRHPRMWRGLKCGIPRDWRSSRRRHCRSMTPRVSWMRCARAFRNSAARDAKTSVTRLRIARTRSRQLLEQCDVLVVVGSPTSSNSNRLREIAEKRGVPGYLVDGPDDLRREWFEGKRVVGVTAGASAPEILVQTVIARLQEWGGANVEEIQGRPESVVFSLPKALRIPVVGSR